MWHDVISVNSDNEMRLFNLIIKLIVKKKKKKKTWTFVTYFKSSVLLLINAIYFSKKIFQSNFPTKVQK